MQAASDVALSSVDGNDDVGGLDELDELDELDAAPVPNVARRRRSQSRPRLGRVKVTRGASKATHRASKVPVAPDEQTSQQVRNTAESVARQVCAKNSQNLDLVCQVFGVTHRGGFKLRVMHLEEVTSSMVDRWRAVCLTRGYASTVSFDVTASEALIVATPILKATGWASWCGNACGKMDPLNAVFLGALTLNTLRHALVYFDR